MCNTDQGNQRNLSLSFSESKLYVITLVFRKFPKYFNFQKVSVKAYKVCGNVISNILCAIQIRAIKDFPRTFYCDHIVFLKLPTHFNFEKASSKAYKVSEMTFRAHYRSGQSMKPKPVIFREQTTCDHTSFLEISKAFQF